MSIGVVISQDGERIGAAKALTTSPGGVVVGVAPTVTAGAYSAKDVVGGLLTFANAVREAGGKGKINTLLLTDLGVTANVLQLWLFDTAPTAIADNAAFDVLDAELPTVIGVIPIAAADYYVATDNQVACVRNVGLEFSCVGTSLYGYLMCTGTPTYASTADITVTLGIEYLS